MTTPSSQKNKSKAPQGYEATYNDLILTAAGILKVQTELPVVYEVARYLFDRWIRRNNATITKYWKIRAELDYKYYVHTMEDGNPVYEYVDQKPVLKDGMAQEDHQKEWESLNQTVIIVYP